MLSRVFVNTKKLIQRSGWSGWGSISVMTLTFLVACIFGGLAFFVSLLISHIESRNNVLVFFEVGVDKAIIDKLSAKWATDSRVKSIKYTSEEEAFLLYADFAARAQPVQSEGLKTNTTINGKLNSNLDIQIYSLDTLKDLQTTIRSDIEAVLEELKIFSDDPSKPVQYKYSLKEGVPPILLRVDSANLDKLRETLLALRVAGLSIMSLLFVVIFFFTLMTVEFRMYNQMEEIGVMQLVGGSLFFIRAPYVFEGGIYGLIGALLATLILGTTLAIIFIFNAKASVALFFFENFSGLSWPYISPLGWGLVVLLLALGGLILGSFNSLLSIRRYIR